MPGPRLTDDEAKKRINDFYERKVDPLQGDFKDPVVNREATRRAQIIRRDQRAAVELAMQRRIAQRLRTKAE